MNTWQVCQQVKYLLQQQKWTGSSTTVFGRVVITTKPTEEAVATGIVMPGAMVRPLSNSVDPDAGELPDAIELELVIALIVSVENDPFGEAMLIGAQRTGQTDSRGRGLLEIEEEMFNAVELLNTDDGVLIQHIASGAPAPTMISGNMAVIREYGFRAFLTSDRFYHPVSNLQET